MAPQTHTNHTQNSFFPPPVGGHHGWKEFESTNYNQSESIRVVVDKPARDSGTNLTEQPGNQISERALSVARYLLSTEDTTELGAMDVPAPAESSLWLGTAKLGFWMLVSVGLGVGLSQLL